MDDHTSPVEIGVEEQVCPSISDSEVDEINAKFNGIFRLILVFAAVTVFLVHYIAQIYCGVTGKPFVVSSETNYMVIAFVVAAIGGESAVQAYKVWKRK